MVAAEKIVVVGAAPRPDLDIVRDAGS